MSKVTLTTKIKAFFGIPEATDAEADARLDTELARLNASEEDADEPEEVPEAEAQATEQEATLATTVVELVSAEVKAVVGPLVASLESLSSRLEVLENQEQEQETGAEKETGEQDDVKSWSNNPITQRVAKQLVGKK